MKRGGRVPRFEFGGHEQAHAEQDFGGNRNTQPGSFNQNVNYTQAIPAATYGISQGVNTGQINVVPKNGGPSTSQSLVGSTGTWGAAISTGSQLGTGLFGGADKSATSNAISTGVFDPAQNLNVWNDPNFNTVEKIYSQANPFYYGFEKNSRDKKNAKAAMRPTDSYIRNTLQNSINSNYDNSYTAGTKGIANGSYYAEGGQVNYEPYKKDSALTAQNWIANHNNIAAQKGIYEGAQKQQIDNPGYNPQMSGIYGASQYMKNNMILSNDEVMRWAQPRAAWDATQRQQTIDEFNNFSPVDRDRIKSMQKYYKDKGQDYSIYAQGGMTPTSSINIEGNELMVNPQGTITRDFKNYPPHPASGTNPMGDVQVPQGSTIIPRNRRKYYQESARDTRRSTIAGLGIMQKNREKFADGGKTLADYGYDPSMFAQNYMSGQAYTGQQGSQGNLSYFDTLPIVHRNTPLGPPGTGHPEFVPGYNPPYNKPQGQPIDYRGIANTGMEYLAPAYNIGMGLFGKADKLNADTYMTRPINATHVSDEESLREIGTAYNTGLYNMKNSGRYGKSGQVSLAAQRMKAAAGSRERVANLNVEIDNRTAGQNADIDARNKRTRFEVDDWNAKSKAAKRNQLDTGIGQVSDLSVQDRYGREERDAIEYYYPNSYNRKKRKR